MKASALKEEQNADGRGAPQQDFDGGVTPCLTGSP
jgi:hypothetical protein